MQQDNAIVERGLIVESSFRSRLELVADLRANGGVREIVEAKSIADGLRNLETYSHDACFIGPALSEGVAVDFIKQGAVVSRNRECAFVAVVNDSQSVPSALIEAGAHGVLKRPFTRQSFTAIVEHAVQLAVEASGAVSRVRGYAPKIVSLSDVLDELSSGLTEVASELTSGKLSLQRDGTPSLASQDAIRIVVERAVSGKDSFDQLFVNAVVQWFNDRVKSDQRRATENLRKRLLGAAN